MRALLISLSLLVIVALVPVSAWATAEQDVGSSVPASSGDAFSDGSASSDAVPEPDQTDAAASEPAAESALEDLIEEADALLAQEETPTEQIFTIWDKPFNEYTPTEGYLFLLFVLLLSSLVFKLFKGGIW